MGSPPVDAAAAGALIWVETGKALSDAKGEVAYAEEAVRLAGEPGPSPSGVYAGHKVVCEQGHVVGRPGDDRCLPGSPFALASGPAG